MSKGAETEIAIELELREGLSVSMRYENGGIHCTWDPDIPSEISDRELERYSKGLSEMAARIAASMGVAEVSLLR